VVVRGTGGVLIGVVPLIVGVVRAVGDSGGDDGVPVKIIVLAFDIRAGNMRGPGDWGGRITLGWRRADRGTNAFEPPPLNPYVLPRLTQSRESLVGRAVVVETEAVSSGDDRYERARERWRQRRRVVRKRGRT
jgi:hypothetical protein